MAVSMAAALLALAGCGGRADLAPVEYLWEGGTAPTAGGSVAAAEPMPAVVAAPVDPVSPAPVFGGAIESAPLEPAHVDPAPVAPAGYPAVAGDIVASGETVVAPGETLSAVSRRTGVPLRDLIVENGLVAPFTLQPGQRLRLPETRYHTVAKGDTVYNISNRYGVDQASLMAENGIAPPFTIKLGQRLRIPGRVQTAPAPIAATTAIAAIPAASAPTDLLPGTIATAPVAPSPEPPSIVIVEPDPDSLPPPADGSYYVPPPSETARADVPRPGTKPQAPPEAPRTAVAAATTPAAPARPAVPGNGGLRFAWPVAGDVISGFGPKSGGQHNDGLNIQAAKGATVRAAEAGVVAYAGDEIRGFGNLVLIKHDGTYMTAYAHNDALLVKQGDRVARGQPIARVGNTGHVTVPQLHFEVRKAGTPVDPVKYLDGGAG
ncbi:peptidoglycan DD-metalloendopeptidase family protein [Zavarzinia compransoris]|nr:peptidoglycan DD-metalloendopeptidase family protein [Zavarzinia marina]